jgi:hypothetical protein
LADTVGDPRQNSMFGPPEAPNKAEVLEVAYERAKERWAPQKDLFGDEAAPAPASRSGLASREGAGDGRPQGVPAEAVAAAKARIKSRINELVTGESGEQRWQIDPRDFDDLILIGKDYVQKIGRDFQKFSEAMKAEFGEVIEPYLLRIYTKARTDLGDRPNPPTPAMQPKPQGRDALVAPGLSLVEKSPIGRVNQAPKVVPFPGRQSERGSISLKPVNPPTTPGELYAAKLDALREEARKGASGARLDAAKTKLKADTVDSTAILPDTLARAQKEGKYEVSPEANISSRIDRALQSGAMADAKIDAPIPGAGNRGLRQLIREVEDASHLDNYLIAQHAQAVRAAHPKASIGKGRTAAEDAAYLNEFRDRVAIKASAKSPAMTYGQVADRIADYSRDILLYAVKSGLISPELAGHLDKIYPNHVPLDRVFSLIEEGGGHQQGGRGPASLSRQTVVMKLEGSERPVENSLFSLLEKTHRVFREGSKNEAARTLAEYRNGVKDSKGIMQKSGFEGLITELGPGESAPSHLKISYLDGGKKREFKTIPEIAAAAKSLDVQQIGLFAKVINFPVRVAKAGTVGFNIPFLVANLFADSAGTKVNSKHSGLLNDPRAFMEAFLAALPGRPGAGGKIWAEMKSEAAGGTSFDMYRNANPVQTVEAIRATRSVDDAATHLIRHPIHTTAMLFREVENFVSRSEQFGRARIYAQTKRALLKEGRSEKDARTLAALASNRDLPPYHLAGNVMRAMGAPLMFLNARTQGTRVDLRALKDSPARTGIRIAARLMFPVALATVWNLSSEERRKAYKDLQPYELDGNLTFLMPGVPSRDKQGRYSVLKFKLPAGLNNATIPVRRMIETLAGMDPLKVEEMAESLFGFVSPVSPADAIPQAIKPSVQAAANYDFFRKQPQVPGRLRDVPPEMQVHPHTSGTAKKIGSALGAIPLKAFKGGVAPIKVEEFIKGTLGGAGAQLINASDHALYAAGVIPKSDIGGTSLPEALGARVGKARGGEQENREYELKKSIELDAERKAITEARKTPYFLQVSKNEEMAQRYLNSVAARARNQVQQLTLSPRYRRMETEQKIAELRKLKQRLDTGAAPTRLYRPIQPPIVPPSQRSRYELSSPGPVR